MARIDLPDGRWIDMRPMYLSDKNAIVAYEAQFEGEEVRFLDHANAIADLIRPGVLATSWGGDIAEMPEQTLLRLIPKWQVITDEAAVPPVSGTSSVTPSRPPASPKGKRR